LLPQLAKQFEAIGIRQAEIEDDDVGLFFQPVPHRNTVFGVNTVDSGGSEGRAQYVPGGRIVFNN